MGVYQQKLEHIISLGDAIWFAEYKFPGIDQATGAGRIVAQQVPEIRAQASSLKADLVVAEFDDCSRLFFGGLISDEAVSAAHKVVLDHGGEFDVAHQPPESDLILTATGVERGIAPTLEAELADLQPKLRTGETRHPFADVVRAAPSSYLEGIDRVLALGPEIWCAEYRFDSLDNAEIAAQIVAAGIPEFARLSEADRAAIHVGELEDGCRLFVGGLMSNAGLFVAHTFIESAGGEFLHCCMPGGKALLTSFSVETLGGIEVEPIASESGPAPRASALKSDSKDEEFDAKIAPNDWLLEFRFPENALAELAAVRVLSIPAIAELAKEGKAKSEVFEIYGLRYVFVAGPFDRHQLQEVHRFLTDDRGTFYKCRLPADARDQEHEIERSLFGAGTPARRWWKFWA